MTGWDLATGLGFHSDFAFIYLVYYFLSPGKTHKSTLKSPWFLRLKVSESQSAVDNTMKTITIKLYSFISNIWLYVRKNLRKKSHNINITQKSNQWKISVHVYHFDSLSVTPNWILYNKNQIFHNIKHYLGQKYW
jgi:hypothetical protein